MSKFIRGIVIVTIPSVLGSIGAITAPAVGSPTCMTQEEARKAFPRDHIYWHGKEHCWDNIGKRSQKPVANANTAEASASSEINRLDEKPLSKSEPVIEKPSEPVVIPPVSFIGDDLRRELVWPVVEPSANDMAADVQQDDPLPSPLPEPEEDIVIGAPNAAPGSPEYLLVHCCWPPAPLDRAGESVPLPHMVIASTSGSMLAIGLWLFVHRRRQQKIYMSGMGWQY
jgi:hypothetical protein